MNSEIKLAKIKDQGLAANQMVAELNSEDTFLSYYWPCYWPVETEIDCDCAEQ